MREVWVYRPSTVIFIALAAGVALGHKGATGVVAERMAIMKNMGRELKSIADLLAAPTLFDPAAAIRHAHVFHEHCHKTTSTLFPPGSIDHHSRALPTIWEKPGAFKEEIQQLHSAAEALVAAAASGDRAKLTAAVRDVQETCTECHETFRRPED